MLATVPAFGAVNTQDASFDCFSHTDSTAGLCDGSLNCFDKDDDWTVCGFFRIENSAADERTIISKWDTAGTRQFTFRLDRQDAPTGVEIYMGGAVALAGNDSIALDTWYMSCATNTGSATTLRFYTYDMAGAVIDDGTSTANSVDDSTQTASINIGAKSGDCSGDEMDGDLAFVGYWTEVWTTQDTLDYLYNPVMKAAQKATTTAFFLPLIDIAVGVDWSGQDNTFALTGTFTYADSPPVGSSAQARPTMSITLGGTE